MPPKQTKEADQVFTEAKCPVLTEHNVVLVAVLWRVMYSLGCTYLCICFVSLLPSSYGKGDFYLNELLEALSGGSWEFVWAQQWFTMTDQLNMGVRELMLDPVYVFDEMRLCHCGTTFKWVDAVIDWLDKVRGRSCECRAWLERQCWLITVYMYVYTYMQWLICQFLLCDILCNICMHTQSIWWDYTAYYTASDYAQYSL